MRYLLGLTLAALLAGCATQSTTQTYRPPEGGDQWLVTGELNEATGMLLVKVNGATAIKGRLSVWDGSGSVAGEYQGRPMQARCNPNTWQTKVNCLVFVGSELAGELSF